MQKKETQILGLFFLFEAIVTYFTMNFCVSVPAFTK